MKQHVEHMSDSMQEQQQPPPLPLLLLDLPSAVLEQVLCQPSLDHQDLCRAARACRRLHAAAAADAPWGRLLEQQPGAAHSAQQLRTGQLRQAFKER